jgi:hypothetical protein
MVFILSSDIYSVNIIGTARFSIHYVFYILIILQLLYELVITHFDTSVQASECLLCWIRLTGQFVRSDPAAVTEIYILVTGWHSIYRVTRHTHIQTNCVLYVWSHYVMAETDRRNSIQIRIWNFCINQDILFYCWIDRHCWMSDTTTVFVVVSVQYARHFPHY